MRLTEIVSASAADYAPPDAWRLSGVSATRFIEVAGPADAPLLVRGENVGVSFSFSEGWFGKRQFQAVKGATLSLKRGETLGIVGESGSGKSIIAQTVMGLLPAHVRATEGQALLLGEDVLKYTPEQLREELRWIEAHVDGHPYGIDLVMPEKFVRAQGRQEFGAEDLWAMVPEGGIPFPAV